MLHAAIPLHCGHYHTGCLPLLLLHHLVVGSLQPHYVSRHVGSLVQNLQNIQSHHQSYLEQRAQEGLQEMDPRT